MERGWPVTPEDERFAERLRAAWPAPTPSAGFDVALERRIAGPRRAALAFALAGVVAAAAAAVVVLRPAQVPLEGPLDAPPPEVAAAVADDEFYAVLDLEAEEDEWLPEDYVGLAEVLDL